MQLLNVTAVGNDYSYRWPDGNTLLYPHWIEYQAVGSDGDHNVRIGFGSWPTYGRARRRVVVWIDDRPQVEFQGADDFNQSGDILSEIKVPGDAGERICRYPDEPVPERYSGLPVVGLPTRILVPGVHRAWAVLANIADHRVMFALAALRRIERNR